MPTRAYARGAVVSINRGDLNAKIDAALGLSGCDTTANATTVFVTHASLVAGMDATVAATIAAYVPTADYGVDPETINLRGAVATLRQWADDADAAVAAWDGQTQAQKNATVKVVTQRLGTFMDRFADLLTVLGRQ